MCLLLEGIGKNQRKQKGSPNVAVKLVLPRFMTRLPNLLEYNLTLSLTLKRLVIITIWSKKIIMTNIIALESILIVAKPIAKVLSYSLKFLASNKF